MEPTRTEGHPMDVMLAADRFTAYDVSHQVVLVIFAVGAVGLVRLGRRHRGTAAADRFSKGFALTLLAVTLPLQVHYLTPGQWDLERSLPVQLCDLAWMTAIYALWSHRWWAVGLTYFWGLTLTTQAMITPDLASTFPDPVFLLFWTMHLLVIWSAIYLTWGLGLAPDWRSYRTAVSVTAVWAVCVFCLNLVAGTNYGYLNEKPNAASILDLLGDWPWYVFAEMGLIIGVWALVTWPWVRLRSRRTVESHRATDTLWSHDPHPARRPGDPGRRLRPRRHRPRSAHR
jgi:hypothetical integral membrane protein (TIGR02206 family)